MTMTNDGKFECDRCGKDVGNGSVFMALVVADLDVTTGQPVQLHFCRDSLDDNDKVVKGCDGKVLTATTLANRLKTYERYVQPNPDEIMKNPEPPAPEDLPDTRVRDADGKVVVDPDSVRVLPELARVNSKK